MELRNATKNMDMAISKRITAALPTIEDAKTAPAIVTPAPSMKLPVVVNYDEAL